MTDAHKAWLETPLGNCLGVDYPIVQGPFNGLPSQNLTAAVSNFGALGSYGAHGLAPSAIAKIIGEIRALTARPFAMNLWVSMQDDAAVEVDEKEFERSLDPLTGLIKSMGGAVPDFAPYVPQSFEQQARVLLEANVPVFSFICGIPPPDILQECTARGIRTIGSATTVDEAIALAGSGVDAIVASGFEGGGHRGSFLRPARESLTGTFALVPQVVDAVAVPVIAAGGIADARGVLAALALGAAGVQLGTAFVATPESGADDDYRHALLSPEAQHTVLTERVSGRLARGIENELMRALDRVNAPPLPYPMQRALVRNLTFAADRAGRSDWRSLWAGQSAALVRGVDAITLLQTLVRETGAQAAAIARWSAALRRAAPR